MLIEKCLEVVSTYQLIAQVVEEVPLALEALVELPEDLKLVVHVVAI